jgi:amidase
VVRIGRDHTSFAYDPRTPAVVSAAPGDTVVFETVDARSGAMLTLPPGSLVPLPPPPAGRGNPVTGPVAVRGAEPGDALIVEVLEIACADVGYTGAHAHLHPAAPGRIPHSVARICAIRDGMVEFAPGVSFPVRPMIGCIGTAPAGDACSTGLPGTHGGNLDHQPIGPGARVYLPVAVPGALLSIGDVHAAMGDGELSTAGIETAAVVTVSVALRKGLALRHPWIETADRVMALAFASEFEQARRDALESMIAALERQRGLSAGEALMLIAAVGDLRIGQACGGMPMTLRLELPRALGVRPGL